jgi:NADH-quinone oxidoreductase subunit N
MNAILLTAIWGIIMMFGGVFFKSKQTPKYWAIAGLVLIIISNYVELKTGASFFDIDTKFMLSFNSFNLTFITIALVSTLLYFLLSGSDIEKVGDNVSEYFALIFFVLCGVCLSATYNTLLILFLGIEIMSIPLYILTGSDKRNLKSNEAALKYFLMGAFSTGIMLMGIAFIYGGNSEGSFFISNINIGEGKMPVLIAIGMVFMLIALSFKVSAAPFHFWTPDVYEGAPTVFTSFMATVVKIAGFIAFLMMRQLGEMVVEEPISGSFSSFANKYWGPFAGFASGWNYWILYILVSMAELTAIGKYVQFWWPEIPLWASSLFFFFVLIFYPSYLYYFSFFLVCMLLFLSCISLYHLF